MDITSTLSRLKNYFIGWHTANYETLHELTDEITNDENDPRSRYAIRSRAIKQLCDYIQNQLDNTNIEINNIKGDVGTPCTPQEGDTIWKNICNLWTDVGNTCSNPHANGLDNRFRSNLGLWENICRIWTMIGEWYKEGESDWNDPRGDWTGEPFGQENWTKGRWTIAGWIKKLYKRTENLNTRTSKLEIDYWGLYRFHPGGFQDCIDGSDNYIDVQFVRKGNVCSCTLLRDREGLEDTMYNLYNIMQKGTPCVMLDTNTNKDGTSIRQIRGNLNGTSSKDHADNIRTWFQPAYDTYLTTPTDQKATWVRIYNTKANTTVPNGEVTIACTVKGVKSGDKGYIHGTCTYVCSN